MKRELLDQLISAGEGQTVEFKETFAELPEALKTFSAFAGQEVGGTVLFGITDGGQLAHDFRIAKNRPEKVAAKVKESVISMASGESLLPVIHTFVDPPVLAMLVPPNAQSAGPYVCRGRRYLRSGKSTHEAKVNYRQLVVAYNTHLWDDESGEYMAYRFCPKCGGTDLKKYSRVSPRDDVWYFAECPCGWMDASE